MRDGKLHCLGKPNELAYVGKMEMRVTIVAGLAEAGTDAINSAN